ncbi:bifunctional metallophosphatase/5'-nucleotidase [Clostridium lacusfryxellense]|uniref:bifunctional metallophosphatase/5'-nucleotidase n=1 Tax=Clostridium lacusfryxellense TaxID=205328 RepID=UPI001C0B50CF|nr:bifunctional UDP-sugar hydrolase/5'-nucleotidase [Clostridium lacusfryxellense]MBU3114085.1 bifunctional metallophosphatase/5'-nucleotidase [Clostridium lacusfryxellense]
MHLDEEFKLTILETSDVHGSILPINYSDNSYSNCGLAALSTIIRDQRKINKNTLLIDNGDMLQGTAITYFHAKINNDIKNPMIEVMNLMGYDVAVIGNHEFNYGRVYLEDAIKLSNFPWICANITKKTNGESFTSKPYIIKTFDNGLKVGILGLTTKYIPNWENPETIEDLNFEDVVESASKWLDIMKRQENTDVNIVSYHGGFERDLETGEPSEKLTGENQAYELCKKVNNMDVLLTGHQHRIIENILVNGVLVLQTGYNARSIGKVSIELTKKSGKWSISSKESSTINANGVHVDTRIVDCVNNIETKTQAWLDTPMGDIEGDMIIKDPFEARLKDNAYAEFINNVQMDAAKVDISNTAIFDNHCKGFKNNVTMRDIIANYKYPNTLKVISLKGADIKAALEKSAQYFSMVDGNLQVSMNGKYPKVHHYNYDMWEGIEYVIDVSKPINSRITKINYKNNPLNMEEDYAVVMNNYRAGGGGDYLMFKGKPILKDIPIDMAELIANYILVRKTVKVALNNNWKVI